MTTNIRYVNKIEKGLVGPLSINEVTKLRKALDKSLKAVGTDKPAEITKAEAGVLEKFDAYLREVVRQENSVGKIT